MTGGVNIKQPFKVKKFMYPIKKYISPMVSVDHCWITQLRLLLYPVVVVHTRSRLDTASSNDQNMDTTPSLDHCKKEVMVVPTTACGSLTSVPSSDQKVHMHQQHSEDGVLAKKLPFEDFCTELEVVSSVEKGIFDGGLFVKSEVDPLKVVPPLIFCQWDTDKKGSPCGVPEIGAQRITLDSGSGDDQIIEVCSSNSK